MNKITQDMRFRLSLIKYADKYGVTKAAIKFKTNRQYIYRWKRRYNGSIESLRNRSRRPHHHPNQHTPDEIKLIMDMRRRNPYAGLVVFWVKLRKRGYTRSIPGLYRFLRKQGIMAAKPPNPKYVAKPYEQMQYPGPVSYTHLSTAVRMAFSTLAGVLPLLAASAGYTCFVILLINIGFSITIQTASRRYPYPLRCAGTPRSCRRLVILLNVESALL